MRDELIVSSHTLPSPCVPEEQWGRSRAVWTCERCDSHAKISKCTRLYLPTSPTISQRSRSTSDDRQPISSNLPRLRHTKRALVNAGACESHLRHVHTARDRPHSTKWSRMVPVGASLILVDFPWFCSEPSKLSDAPTGTILDHFVE